ncbi:MAG: hypothetical protein WCT20_03750 [Candidatus Babeliales bacterium]
MFSIRRFAVVLFQIVFVVRSAGVAIVVTKPQLPQRESVCTYIKNTCLPTVAAENEQEKIKYQEEKAAEDRLLAKSWLKLGKPVRLPVLHSPGKMVLAYGLFENQPTDEGCYKYIDKTTQVDLEVIVGQKDQRRSLFAVIEPYAHTSLGKVYLQKMLCQPQVDSDELRKRQERIKILLGGCAKLEKIEAQLSAMGNAESDFLWFWEGNSEQTFDDYAGKIVPSTFTDLTSFIGLESVTKKIRMTPWLTELAVKYNITVEKAVCICSMIMFLCAAKELAIGEFNKLPKKFNGFVAQRSIASFVSYISCEFILLETILHCLGAPGSMYGTLTAIPYYNTATNAFHNRMNNVATFIDNAQKILGQEASIAESGKSATFMELLKTPTFKQEPSWLAYKGRVTAGFLLMNELYKQFEPMLIKIAELDAYVAIANFMRAHEKTRNGNYCFPKYIEKDTPYLNLSNYWHPFLNPETVATNDIEFGGTVARNIIVTGPNAGGKSTALKSITLAVLMAQTLGIAPATSMTLTPFKIINTYMNVTDNTGSESLFQAEMHRAAQVINMINNLKGKEFAFVVMDEMFTGTNALEGMSASHGIIKKLVASKNSVLIFATHFKELTGIENEINGLVKNYKVMAEKQPDGHFFYPYKLIPGISDQTIALDLLAHEGFDNEILVDAQETLKRAKKGN